MRALAAAGAVQFAVSLAEGAFGASVPWAWSWPLVGFIVCLIAVRPYDRRVRSIAARRDSESRLAVLRAQRDLQLAQERAIERKQLAVIADFKREFL